MLKTSSRSIVGLLAIVLSLSGASTARAAQTDPPRASGIEERTAANLRLLDIVAVDGKGRPLTGLTPSDFVVTVNGQDREILSFDSSTALQSFGSNPLSNLVDPRKPLAARPEPTPRPGRWIVILLDADRVPVTHRTVVMEAARSVVQNSGGPDDRFAIALLSAGDLNFIQEFAPAENVAMTIFDNPGMLHSRSQGIRFQLDEMTELMQSCNSESNTDSCVLARSEEFLAITRAEAENGVKTLRALVAAMTPLPGRKALVWFSNGIILRPGEVVEDAATRYVADPRYISSRLEDFGNHGYDALMEEASRAQVSLFGLRAGAGTGSALRGADRQTNDRALAGLAGNPFRLANSMGQQSLRDVAEATGGAVVFTPLKPKTAFGLLDRLDGIYTVGIPYRQGDGSGTSGIKVKLTRRKGKVTVQRRAPRRSEEPAKLSATVTENEGQLIFEMSLKNAAIEKESEEDAGVSRLALYAHIRTADGRVLVPYYRVIEVARGGKNDSTFLQSINVDPPAGQLPSEEYLVEVFVSDLVGGGQGSAALLVSPPS